MYTVIIITIAVRSIYFKNNIYEWTYIVGLLINFKF